MERIGVSRPPKPIYGRIPNFIGAEEAARRLLDIKEFIKSNVVKVNPDSPQRPVRELILKLNKILVMPTPRLRKGFLILYPNKISDFRYASTIRGAFKYGEYVHPSRLPYIDFIVEGSVAVSLDCNRLGKGEGYGELEYAILLEYNKIDLDIPIATTIHEVQIINHIERDLYDVSINYIITPKRIIRCDKINRPRGILWNKIKKDKLEEIPILKELWIKRYK